jgi:hypothetical protein
LGPHRKVAVGDEAVRARPNNGLGADVAAGAGPVFNDELLTEPVRQPLSTMRALMSAGPPAAKPTIQGTGRDG